MLRNTVLLLTVVAFASCDAIDFQPNNGSSPQGFRETLVEFNGETAATFDASREMFDAREALETQLAGTDDEAISAAVDDQAAAIANLATHADRLAELEEQISSATDGQAIIPALGVALGLFAIQQFAEWSREASDRMIAARDRAGEALADGDSVRYQENRDEMEAIGEEVINELTIKVTTTLVTTPLGGATPRGIKIKDRAGNLIEGSLRAISATHGCAKGWDDPDCRIGLTEGQDGEVGITGPGPTSVVVVTEDNARIEIAEVDPAEGTARGRGRPRPDRLGHAARCRGQRLR